MAQLVHGHTRRNPKGKRVTTSEWRIFNAMKSRCLNKNTARYPDYGGRGIKICDRWLLGCGKLNGFQCFLKDMGERPSCDYSLDRIDNNAGYSPENCKWSTRIEQGRNTRSNRIIKIKGKSLPLSEAVEMFSSVSPVTVRMRLHRGWDEYHAITAPIGAQRKD